jgi:hypothetical protein
MTGAQDEVSRLFHRRRIAGTAITPNEREWIEIIRLATFDSDPSPTLDRVQKLRQVFQQPHSKHS